MMNGSHRQIIKFKQPKAGDIPPTTPNTLQSLGSERLSSVELGLISAIAVRALDIAMNHAVGGVPDELRVLNPQVLSTDIGVCHLLRRLKLDAFMASGDLIFIAEFSTIQKYINRQLMFFPQSVKLRFASIGATF